MSKRIPSNFVKEYGGPSSSFSSYIYGVYGRKASTYDIDIKKEELTSVSRGKREAQTGGKSSRKT